MELFDDPVTVRDLNIELAAMTDADKNFVKATYYLEGDGPLVFRRYERLSALAHAIAIESYPNTEAKAHEHAGENMVFYYVDTSVLLENTPLVKLIQNCLR